MWRSVVRVCPKNLYNRCLISKRLLSQHPRDPKHVFTEPAADEVRDPKHFFTSPPPTPPRTAANEEVFSSSIQQAMLSQKRQQRKSIVRALFIAVFGVIFGYSIGYKVLYCHEKSFIPLYPAPRARKLSKKDLKRLNIEDIKQLAQFRVLGKLTAHNMIKEEYGIPLKTADGKPPTTRDFSIWCEDQDPCVTGVLFKPYERRIKDDGHTWHTLFHLLQFRITHKPISISSSVESMLNLIGLGTSDLFQVVNPEKVYGDFKYEFPLQHGEEDHSMHIWFLGEMELGNDLIVYKGKYHVDVKLQQIDLLRREEGKLIRYVLYKEE